MDKVSARSKKKKESKSRHAPKRRISISGFERKMSQRNSSALSFDYFSNKAPHHDKLGLSKDAFSSRILFNQSSIESSPFYSSCSDSSFTFTKSNKTDKIEANFIKVSVCQDSNQVRLNHKSKMIVKDKRGSEQRKSEKSCTFRPNLKQTMKFNSMLSSRHKKKRTKVQ